MSVRNAQPEDTIDREEHIRTEKQTLIAEISTLLATPNEKHLGAVKRAVKALLKSKQKGGARLVLLAMAKVFFNLLPTYNIHTKGYKYQSNSKTNNYEYLLMMEWQAYLKLVTRSKTEESFEAAAILLPQTILFNKSGKLIGKVVKGTGLRTKTGKKCIRTLKKIFICDKGNRIVKILEVINQMNIDKVPRGTVKSLPSISDEVLEKPLPTERLIPQEMRKLSTEEKAVKKEAQLHFLPEQLKAWKGINERLLRIYLLILTEKSLDKNAFILGEIQRLRIPGNLQEGIFTVLAQAIREMKADLTPARVPILAQCYTTLHKVFGKKLDFAFQSEDLEKIPLDILTQVDNGGMQQIYSSVQQIERGEGTPELIKLLIKRGMYRIDPSLADAIKHLMPKGGVQSLMTQCPGGFWELALLRPREK
ncbi:hypothetical protein NEDG_01908 [Nematocida displodere]|uniref:Nucleolar complex-associated protein 3 N-terminal domain-containing protein n=1 Tax=Nematocida displodere TaxID=1805483 RepID=A0A177EGP3_9MICR|nr:hypothetical protein NEDG_01908 [Nematocida displodere]